MLSEVALAANVMLATQPPTSLLPIPLSCLGWPGS